MSGIVGTLLQAFVNIEWGGVNLSNVDDGNGGTIILPQNFKTQIDKDGSAPSCSFELVPSPIGFNTFAELKNTALDQAINVKLGYEDGTILEWKFQFVGMGMTTGHNPKIEVNGVSIIKGSFTDNKISYTMEEPIPLTELPEFLKKKGGAGAELLQFKFVGSAEQAASQVQYHESVIERTPYSILTDALRPHGIQVQSGDSVFAGEIILSRPPTFEGEGEQDPAQVNSGSSQPQPGLRSVYIISIGVMENLVRDQSFNAGQNDPSVGSSKSKAKSYEQEQAETGAENAGRAQRTAAESANEDGGTSGTSRIPSTMSRTEGAQDEEAKKGRAAITKLISSKLTFNVMMVPYLVGIKPRDFVAIPSLNGAEYIEDWEVESVNYSQDNNGQIRVAVTAWRPFTGLDPLLDAGTLAAVTGVASSLESPEDWANFYWSGGKS